MAERGEEAAPGSFGERVKRLREERNMGQTQLASRAGLQQAYLSKVEQGKFIPKRPNLVKLARGLSMTVEEVIDGFQMPTTDPAEELEARVLALEQRQAEQAQFQAALLAALKRKGISVDAPARRPPASSIRRK